MPFYIEHRRPAKFQVKLEYNDGGGVRQTYSVDLGPINTNASIRALDESLRAHPRIRQMEAGGRLRVLSLRERNMRLSVIARYEGKDAVPESSVKIPGELSDLKAANASASAKIGALESEVATLRAANKNLRSKVSDLEAAAAAAAAAPPEPAPEPIAESKPVVEAEVETEPEGSDLKTPEQFDALNLKKKRAYCGELGISDEINLSSNAGASADYADYYAEETSSPGA